jgi:hypothetical protein
MGWRARQFGGDILEAGRVAQPGNCPRQRATHGFVIFVERHRIHL